MSGHSSAHNAKNWEKKKKTVGNVELSLMINNFLFLLSCMVATSHLWLLSIRNVPKGIEKLNFLLYLVLSTLNFNVATLNGHMHLVTDIWTVQILTNVFI